MSSSEIVKSEQGNGGSSIVKESSGFGTVSAERSNEMNTSASIAKAQAEVQAPYIMAERKPRDWDTVRQKILHECKRPGFAEVAIYAKPVGGKKIEGLSVRFAEAAARCVTNVKQDATTTFDDAAKRTVRITVTDLESNTQYSEEATIEKVVERRNLAKGQKALGSRTNSYGDTVFLVDATADDVLNKQNSAVSKSFRNALLRLVPGDIKEEAMAQIRATRANETAKDPDAARKKMVDAYLVLGVKPADLKSYIGKELAVLGPQEIEHLRDIYTAIKDGETTWKAVVESNADNAGETKSLSLKEHVAKKAAKKEHVAEVVADKDGVIVSSPDPEPGAQ